MHLISQKRIREGIEKYPESSESLLGWMKLMKKSHPRNFAEMKKLVNSVDKVGDYHIFNISGNKLRLIAIIDYAYQKLFIRKILTHTDYDKQRFT